jgi:hypothetical protein
MILTNSSFVGVIEVVEVVEVVEGGASEDPCTIFGLFA